MGTETVDIRFRESGIRVIKRKIDELGQSANNATRGIFLMQRALFVLGGAGLLRGLVRQIDSLTNYENRLKLTTTSAENLDEVQKRLFQTARNSRSSFESVAEIYTRTALSVKELGVSQEQTIQFTQSLAKATIISGASAREANAAMVQLGQGMASNTLRGDELRSVLEQLPFVADVIATHFKVTRGELRRLGEEGKISAKDILDAFAEAEDKIDELFANTTPTIEQALVVAKVNWLQFLDSADDATGASASLANAIIAISKHVDVLATSVLALGSAWVLSFSVKTIQRIATFVLKMKAASVASSRQLEVENRRSAAFVKNTVLVDAENAANIRKHTIGIAQLKQTREMLVVQKASQAITVQNGRARSVLTGQFVSQTAAIRALNASQIALIHTDHALTTETVALAAAQNAQAAAATRATAATTRMGIATVASGTFMARFTRIFPTLAGFIGLVARGIGGLWALIAANPFGAAIVVIGLMITALAKWGNQIKITEDDVVGLNDFIVAAFELTVEALEPILDKLVKQMDEVIKDMKKPWEDFKSFLADTATKMVKDWFDKMAFLPRIILGVVFAVKEAIKVLPDNFTVIAVAIGNAFISMFEDMNNAIIKLVNGSIGYINDLIEFLGAKKAVEAFGFSGQLPEFPELKLPRIPGDAERIGVQLAEAVVKGFEEGVNLITFKKTLEAIEELLKPILDKAREVAARKKAGDLDPGGGGAGGGLDPEFEKILIAMEKQITLLKMTSEERKIGNELLRIEKKLKRDLTEAEDKLAIKVIKRLIAAKEEVKLLKTIEGPREKAIRDLATLHRLYAQGRVEIDDYVRSLKKLREASDAASGTFGGNFKSTISSAIMDVGELGEALGGLVVDAAGRAADAIVEFAQTGKLNIKAFFSELFAQLLRLLTQQLLLQMLFSFFPGSSAAGAAINLTGPNGHDGGSIMPSGAGSTDTQPIFFNKRPDERVDILTPKQQEMQRKQLGENNQSVAAPQDVVVVNTIDPRTILDVLSTKAGARVIRTTMERDATGFRKALSV